MSTVTFEGVGKRFANGFQAVSDLDLDVGDGELLVVVGPSGCGKTTTLRMLAGLEDISAGTIRIGDRVVNEVSSRDRDIAMVFQSYALYPHLTVAGNLGYPLKLAGFDRDERERRVKEVAKLLRLDGLLDRKPRMLSGGQRQRVAMGRAMVREPKVFLMDEPLSNLDAKLRVAMRAEVSELQRSLGTTMFYVTHDQVEAMTMGDRVAVMNAGRLEQVATPNELYSSPATAFVAGFIGSPPMNRILAVISEAGVRSGPLDLAPMLGDASQVVGLADALAGELVLGARPEHLTITTPDHGLPGIVRMVEMLGAEQILHVDFEGLVHYDPDEDDSEGAARRLVVSTRNDQAVPNVGETVGVTLAPRHLHMFDATTGVALHSWTR